MWEEEGGGGGNSRGYYLLFLQSKNMEFTPSVFVQFLTLIKAFLLGS